MHLLITSVCAFLQATKTVANQIKELHYLIQDKDHS